MFADDRARLYEWKPMLIPAILSAFRNVAMNKGITFLEPTLYQLVYQINIVFTSLITPIYLTGQQRMSTVLLFVGIVTILFHRDEVLQLPHHSQLIGILYTIAAAGLTAMYNQSVEDILKSEKNTTWLRQMQLAIFAQIVSVVLCYVNYDDVKKSEGVSLHVGCFVVIKCVGDIIIPFVLKYLDNVTKIFSDTVATLLSLVLSQIIYHWHPHLGFYTGTGVIFVAAYLFVSGTKKHTILTV
jgi:hypothetical protein